MKYIGVRFAAAHCINNLTSALRRIDSNVELNKGIIFGVGELIFRLTYPPKTKNIEAPSPPASDLNDVHISTSNRLVIRGPNV